MATMTEDYVSFQTAELLKEKGMDESCFKHYVQKNNNDGTSEAVTVCTLQMAVKWLRERRIYIMIDRSWSMADSWQYCICVNNDFDNLIQQTSVPNRTYEEAVEAALKYSLENLI